MKNVLISGGAGFIGSRLACALKAKGDRVTVLDLLSEQIHGSDPERSPLYVDARASCDCFIRGDVRDREIWRRALEGQDAVVHLAAETGTGQSMYELSRYTGVNIEGTALLLETLGAMKNKPAKLVVASSRAIYGEGRYRCHEHGVQYPDSRDPEDMRNGIFNPVCGECGRPMDALATDEGSRIKPTSVYGVTKQVQEELALLAAPISCVSTVSLRYQNVYGPGQSLKNPYTGILSIFSTAMLHGNPIDIFEDGEESRDFVYIDDVVEATIRAIEYPGSKSQAVNVGSGNPVSVLRVARTLKDIYGSKSEIRVSGKYRVGDIRHNYADLSLAEATLGFVPRVGFDVGLKAFCDWVGTQEIGEDRYSKSLTELAERGLLK